MSTEFVTFSITLPRSHYEAMQDKARKDGFSVDRIGLCFLDAWLRNDLLLGHFLQIGKSTNDDEAENES